MGNILSLLWNNILYYPFVNLLVVFYKLLGSNLGLAVMLLAIVLRLAMIPLTRKQTNMTSKMSELKPRLEKLEKKFKHNPEKLAKEQMKMYKEVGYNPLGCLGSFLPQIFIFMAILGVIRAVSGGDFDGLYPMVSDWVFGSAEPVLNNQFLWWNLSENYKEVVEDLGYGSVESISYFVLAVLVGVAQFISTKFTQLIQQGSTPKKSDKDSKKKNDQPMAPEEMQKQMMKSMFIVIPFMTFSATLGAPAVLGVYWFTQVIMFMVQYFIINKEKATAAFKEVLMDLPFVGGSKVAK